VTGTAPRGGIRTAAGTTGARRPATRRENKGVRRTGRWRAAAALAAGALLLLTACGGKSGSSDGAGRHGGTGPTASASPSPSRTASLASVRIAPGDGATGVATSGALKVTAAHGTLGTVTVKGPGGATVPGTLSRGGTRWEPTGTLAAATRYTVAATARDSAGRAVSRHAAFTTVRPKATVVGIFTPDDGQTVGVGMEVSLRFTHPVTRKPAVMRGISVTADPPVEIAPHWLGNTRVDFRPEHFWKPGTKITLSLRLNGVEAAPGVYGTQAKDVHVTVGRRQVSVVDAAKHRMKVYRDGKLLRTVPVTTGQPGKDTWNGTMVISEQDRTTRMNGETVGFGGEYDIPDVPHAQRLTDSGTFIHGNYWAGPGVFGHTNASHGCIGMLDVKGGGSKSTPAAWFYDHSMIGDVVEVKHSHDHTVQWWNGLNGWNMPWSEWKAAS
jgi:lipoprotein-anchoring transpeptidase ErfK/SrfK